MTACCDIHRGRGCTSSSSAGASGAGTAASLLAAVHAAASRWAARVQVTHSSASRSVHRQCRPTCSTALARGADYRHNNCWSRAQSRQCMSTRALSGLGMSVKTWQSFHWCINMHASSPQSSRECNGRLAMPSVLTCSICNPAAGARQVQWADSRRGQGRDRAAGGQGGARATSWVLHHPKASDLDEQKSCKLGATQTAAA